MRISLKIIVYLMTGLSLSVTETKGGPANTNCGNKPVRQTAYLGGSVTFNCSYPKTEDNSIKSFCKEDEHLSCTDLISTYRESNTRLSSFSLTDNKQRGVLTLIIFTLTQADAGRYKCVLKAFNESSEKCYSEIHLDIPTWDDLEPNVVKATEESVEVQCPYSDNHEGSDKFLCKGKNPVNCEELIHTTEQDRDTDNGKFLIRDNKRLKYFYVHIRNLSTADSGTYWCGSDRTGQHAEYTKIHLSVTKKHFKVTKLGAPALQTTTAQTPTALHDDAQDLGDTFTLNTADRQMLFIPPQIYAAVIVGVMCLTLLAVALIVLVLYRHKLPCRQGGSSEQSTNTGCNTEGNNLDHNYEEIQMWNQQARSEDAPPSIYATVSPHANQLLYTDVTFHKDSEGDTLPNTNQNGHSACDYSSVSFTQAGIHPPAAEHAL